uniref:Uncharacterized protein n=1 Tax=Wuchereria bancrofti TaxID=6293 RepID=A0AAF5PUC1_WUCBA
MSQYHSRGGGNELSASHIVQCA